MSSISTHLPRTAAPGVAWVSLCLAVALHVADEAHHDFLAVYNPAALRIREQLPFLPLPTFTFDVWITGLAIAVVLGLSLSPLVFRQASGMRLVVTVVASLMLLNALGHAMGSIVTGSVMPGTYSSPILFAAAAWALSRTRSEWAGPRPGSR